MAFDVTDAGRVALSGSMGPEIDQVEGRLLGTQNGEYVVAVSAVRLLRGGRQSWTGEKVSIKSEHVGNVYEHRFSKGRTIALSVALAGAVVLVFNRDLLGLGGDPQMPIDTGVVTLRIRRP